jgi:hypothetical protein
MTTILGITQRFRELGRIRCGELVDIGGGKSRPNKLEKFRLTSPNSTLINAVSKLYGGEVSQWESPSGMQWQVKIETDVIDVLIPPMVQAFSQSWEMWGRGKGILRRCTGDWEQVTDTECMCISEMDDSEKGRRKCTPTTRLNVILPYVQGLGIWRLDTGSYSAAGELPPVVGLLKDAALQMGRPVKATLRLEQRQRKTERGTRNYAVPVVDVSETLDAIMLTTSVLAGPSLKELSEPTHPEQPALPPAPEPLPIVDEEEKPPPSPPGATESTPELTLDAKASVMDQSAWFAMMARKAGFDDDMRHALILTVTNDRTESAKDADKEELDEAIAVMLDGMKGEVAKELKIPFPNSSDALKWLRKQDSGLEIPTKEWGFDDWALARGHALQYSQKFQNRDGQ